MDNVIKNTIVLVFSFLSLMNFANAQCYDSCCPNQEVFHDSCQTDCRTSYRYFTLGTGPVVLIPSAGVGYRSRLMHHGFDLSLNASTVVCAHSVQGNLLYHFYPDYKRQDPWYVGAGVATSFYFENRGRSCFGIAPDFVVGKELFSHRNTKQFLEAHVQAPNWFGKFSRRINAGRLDFPLMYIRYGLAF